MNYSNTSLICDYITLYFSEATTSSGISKWYINQSTYLSNSKGQYALVSVADCAINSLEGGTIGLVLNNPKPLNNGSSSPVIVSNTSPSAGLHTFVLNNNKYLIPARPTIIELKTIKVTDGSSVNLSTGWITLKFEYLSKTAVTEMNNESEYTTF
jgi:hypothetical protein